jgi:hypothetical protein
VPAQANPPAGRGTYPERGAWYLWYEYRSVRILAVILVIALIALVLWLLLLRPSDDETAAIQPGGGPVGTTQQDLIALSQQLGQPIYWAGNIADTRMELTETTNSYAYLRYLQQDAAIGDPSGDFLTVGTYPADSAYVNLRAYARNSRAKIERIANQGVVVTVPGSPTSVYFAYPRQDVQVEVYAPEPRRALELVKSGSVTPVTAVTGNAGAVATPGTVTTPGVDVPTAPPVTTTPGATQAIPPQG